jgi:hypothetical protein
MAGSAVRVKGLREVERAFRNLDKTAGKAIRDDLKRTAEPVADAAISRISAYRGASIRTIKPRIGRGVSVLVRQNARKKTGKRGDFGLLQQRHLEAALDERQGEVIEAVEDVLDRIADREGF